MAPRRRRRDPVGTTPPPPTTTSAAYGVNGTSSVLGSTATDRKAALADIAALGARYVRIDVTWSFIEPSAGAFTWSYYDEVMADIVDAGMEPILLLCYGNPAYGDTLDAAAFARFAAAVAARYAPKGFHTYEVWNEPNLAGPHHLDPAAFVALLGATTPAIHAADPKATVISGGLAPSGVLDYLKAMYAAGARQVTDAVAIHPYIGEGADSMWDVRTVMNANGDAAKKVWATEFGWSTWPTPGNSEALQASRFSQAVGWWKAPEQGLTGAFVAYTHRDTGTDPANPEDWFGLLRYDGSRKPAWTTFQGLVKAG